MTSQLEIDSFI